MNALTARTLATFPVELQACIRSHHCSHHYDDIEELVQQVALSLLEARRDDTMRAIFNRARSAVRRFTQNPAHYGRDIDGFAGVADDDKDPTPPRGKKRRELAREIAADHGVSTRRARQIVAEQVRRAKQGDLFAGYESGVAV